MKNTSWPLLGCGLGLRTPHYQTILETRPKVDWFEAVSENYMDSGGRPVQVLEKIRERYPVALHGTALSIGSSDPLNLKYLERLKRLADRVSPFLVTDHLCWSSVNGEALHDLLPIPFTEEAVKHTVRRVRQVQDLLGRNIALENVSTYVTYRHSAMTEWEFIREVARRSGCGILLDLNNIYVNAVNHDFNPYDYLEGIPEGLVAQFHLAGHTDMGDFLFDTHSQPIIQKVWKLYERALELWGPVSTLIEWDEHIPKFPVLLAEAEKAKKIAARFKSRKTSQTRATMVAIREKSEHGPQKTPGLRKVQQIFGARIAAHRPGSKEPLGAFLNPQHGVPPEERLSVYANGFTARLEEALSETYEGVRALLGADRFSEVCRGYAHDEVSTDYNLNFIGENFPGFLEKNSFQKDKHPAVDLADFEWRIWKAFHAFDKTPLTPEKAARVPPDAWEEARFIFQPSVSVFESRWPVLDLWLSRHEINPAREVKRSQEPRGVLISRKLDQVRCERLGS
ncbi:MAG: DUF692 family protein, partial [Candidatus Omnitrophica bacterium]|nr:DUF692 family protein [Candidatus Omnitrophota bacterium]